MRPKRQVPRVRLSGDPSKGSGYAAHKPDTSHLTSREKVGAYSVPAVLMLGPRFWGGPHGSCTLLRWETQMSSPPAPPGRFEVKYELRPSFEMAGCRSLPGELITAPR